MSHQPQVFVLGNHVQACCWYVDRLPRVGETFQAKGLTVEPGGKGLNVGIGLQRLGLSVFMLLGCGQDTAADALLDCLHRDGLNTEGVFRFSSASGWGAGLIGPDGQTAIAVYPGANLLLRAHHVQAHHHRIASADLVYGQFETAIEAVVEAFNIAHQCGVPTVLNPSPWQTPPTALLSTTSVLLVNETEAASLLDLVSPASGWAGLTCWDDACAWLHLAVAQVWTQWPNLQCLVITLGTLGASVWLRPAGGASKGDVLFMPAATVKAHDPVGAGDAFACGFLAQWLASDAGGKSKCWCDPQVLEVSLRWGQTLGGHMAATEGVLVGLPMRHELEALGQRVQPGNAQWYKPSQSEGGC